MVIETISVVDFAQIYFKINTILVISSKNKILHTCILSLVLTLNPQFPSLQDTIRDDIFISSLYDLYPKLYKLVKDRVLDEMKEKRLL